MKINKYPDGTSYVELDWEREYVGRHLTITFRINSYEDLWHLNQYCEALQYNCIAAKITIPCLLDAQADKRFDEYQSSGLSLIAYLLNMYEDISFEIFHPHNPEVVEASFERVEIIDNNKFINIVLEEVSNLREGDGMYNIDNLILMSSDAGGFKPLMKLCDKLHWQGETYSASKSRKYENGKSILTQVVDKQDFQGKDILIVDDICVKGGTFKGLSKMLRERNCGKLYLAVSHMTIQQLGDDPVTNYFDEVFTTNSKYDEYFCYGEPISSVKPIQNPDNLKVINMF